MAAIAHAAQRLLCTLPPATPQHHADDEQGDPCGGIDGEPLEQRNPDRKQTRNEAKNGDDQVQQSSFFLGWQSKLKNLGTPKDLQARLLAPCRKLRVFGVCLADFAVLKKTA